METVLNYLGLSGGAIAIITTSIYIVRRICNSKCVKDADGHTALQVSLNVEDVKKIEEDPELKSLFLQLKEELKKARGPTPSQSPKLPVSV